MHLPQEDLKLFYRLHPALMVYANQQAGVVESVSTVEDFMRAPMADRMGIRDAAFEGEGVIESFTSENPFGFAPEELAIVESWKHRLQGTFYILRYLKAHAVFLGAQDPPCAYGVRALQSPFEEVAGPQLPAMVRAVLLPFRDAIVYDGFLSSSGIHFGGGIKRSLNDAYREAKARFGIITRLPHTPGDPEQSDLERLKFYLRTADSRELHWDEMWELIHKDRSLLRHYQQHMGRLDSRDWRKRLAEVGVASGWFALLDNVLVAGGTSRKQVESIADELVAPSRRDLVYVFQVRQKK